ncbi:MAG: tetratricopeptide repeat protein [Terriglobia bacterium]
MRPLLMVFLLPCVSALPAIAEAPDFAKLRAEVRAHPDAAAPRRALGWALLEFSHDADSAYRELRVAVRLDPVDLTGQKLLALACLATGRLDRARELFLVVLSRDPEDVWMWVNLGKALAGSSDYKGAHAAYEEALRRQPSYWPARAGLGELAAARAPAVAITWNQFTNSDGFASSSAVLSGRANLGAVTSLSISTIRWSFADGSEATRREDLGVTVSRRLSPAVDLQFTALQFHYSDYPTQVSGGVAATWSRSGKVLTFHLLRNAPVYVENLAVARLRLGQDVYAMGLDWPLTHTVAVQGGFSLARLSDGNTSRSSFAQLSRGLSVQCHCTLRLRYEALSFARGGKPYFSPALFQVLKPETDLNWPLSKRLALEAQLGVPLVIGGLAPGHSMVVGPRLTLGSFAIRAVYSDSKIAGVRVWSGHGLAIQGSARFR